jgi:hypothetical protein
MRLSQQSVWSLLAGLSSVQAQYLVSELSFGFGQRFVQLTMGPLLGAFAADADKTPTG